MKNGILSAIGNTPLIPIDLGIGANVFAKIESQNPGGSVKDRLASFLIEHAEKKGLLKPSGTIVEASSGNLGISLAMIGAMKRYRVIITTGDATSDEKVQAMEAYGAEVRRCVGTQRADDPNNYRNIALNLHREIPNSFLPDQFHNPLNPFAHYTGLGPEIWRDTQGKVTHLFAAAGTGGTVSGVGRFLKEQNPAIQVHAVDAEGSFYSTDGHPKPYEIPAMGMDGHFETFQREHVDTVHPVSDEAAFTEMQNLARSGLLMGPSSGAVVAALLQFRDRLKSTDMAVMIFGDSGRGYLSKSYGNWLPTKQSRSLKSS